MDDSYDCEDKVTVAVTLKALILTVPDELRQQLQGLPKMTLIERCAGLRPGPVTSPAASAKHSIRAMARRWKDLHDEVAEIGTTIWACSRRAAQVEAACPAGESSRSTAHLRPLQTGAAEKGGGPAIGSVAGPRPVRAGRGRGRPRTERHIRCRCGRV